MVKSTTPVHPFARRPAPWYRRLTAPFHAPQGGPPAGEVIPHRVDCGPLTLNFLEPCAAFGEDMGAADPVQLSLDDREFGISNLSQSRTFHPIIELAISNWTYRQPRWLFSRLFPIPHPPYAVITAYWQLERVKHGIRLQPGDSAMLEGYLRHDYIAYLESEGGPNWKVRDEACKGTLPSGAPLPQFRIDELIASRLWSPPESYEPRNCGGLTWLRYIWAPRVRPNTLNYTTTLLPDVLLTASFHVTRMNTEPWEDWWNLFLEDCDNLVKAIVCERKALPSDDAAGGDD